MVSDSEIITRLRDFLQTSDLNTTTAASVRRKLEEDLGIDLSGKKVFVREQIDLYLQSVYEITEDKVDDAGVDEQESDGAPADVDEGEEEEEQIEESKTSNSIEEEEDDENEHESEIENDDDDEQKEVEERTSKKRTGIKRCNKQNKEGKKKGGGFTNLCSLSPQLQKLVGVPEMARTEVVKQLWAYIRKNNLQDPSDRRNIICDKNLHELFRVKKINMFKMNKALAKHIWPLGSFPEGEPDEDKEAHEERVKEEEEAEEENNSSNSKDDDDNEQGKEDEETSTRKCREKKAPNKKNTEVKKRGGGGFTMLCSLSPKLQSFTGVPEMARTQVVKYVWTYIKEKNLQDPSDRRSILCDETLHNLFGVKSINMFQMNKALAKHIWPLEHVDGATVVSSTKRGKQQMQDSEEDVDEEPKRKKKRKKGGTSESHVPLNLSDALLNFLGTDERGFTHANVEKRIWEYIEQNNLQDPSDEKIVICNEKLKELFEVESFQDSALPKLLTSHLTHTEQ